MEFNSSGTLIVRVFAAEEAIPIPDTVVRIVGANEQNPDVRYSLVTDEDGVTEAITLPTPSKSYSMSPGSPESPYSVYDVTVLKDGYYTKVIRNVAVFSGIESVLPVNMIPYVSYRDGGSYPRGNINAIVTENENL